VHRVCASVSLASPVGNVCAWTTLAPGTIASATPRREFDLELLHLN
jgi:hypothetical protein